jgi:hypothetical protein
MAKRVKESIPESDIVKVVDPLYDAPVAVEGVNETPPAPSRPTAGERIRRFFEVLLRLTSWVIIFTVFGAALYYSLPLLYQRFVQPVQQNTAQMGQLQSQQAQTEQELADLQARLESLETGQSQNADAFTELEKRLSVIETEIEARTQSLSSLETMQSELQAQNEETSAELDRQINVLKAMELLSRARLFMYQSNFGLARQDIQIANDLLVEIQPDGSESLAAELDAVIHRLGLTLSNLPNFPVAASDDLDIAWQILLSGMPQAPSATSITPATETTMTTTPQATFTVTPAATTTPTP